jgi:hypothetical protein
MPLPLIAVAIFEIIELIAAALTIYEALDVLNDIYEGLDKYNKGIEAAKKQLEEMIENLKEEIDNKISEKEQVAILLAAAGVDPQNPTTKRGAGWGADNGGIISAAIQQKIPFRRVISEVCDKANAMPVLQVRKKKGVSIKDVPHARRKALEEILKVGLENVADVDLDNFIVVRLKQFAANLMFEFVDYCLDWASPLKCEVSFGPSKQYTDHPSEGTRLKRVGKVNPFYPMPPPNNRRGSISADLVINEYRKKPTGKANLFAIVEIKFEGDKIDKQQFEQYHDLLEKAASVKTALAPVLFANRPVSEGGRLSLFRYPLDKPVEESEDEKKRSQTRKKRRAG